MTHYANDTICALATPVGGRHRRRESERQPELSRPRPPAPSGSLRLRARHVAPRFPLQSRGRGDRRRRRRLLPCAPLLHGRGRDRDLLPRIGLHRPPNPRRAHQGRMPPGRTGRIHPHGLPQRQDGPEPGRGRGRPDQFLQPGLPPAGPQPTQGPRPHGPGDAARKAAPAHLAARTRTGLLRPRRPGLCRPQRAPLPGP